jgi:hypothetical protein
MAIKTRTQEPTTDSQREILTHLQRLYEECGFYTGVLQITFLEWLTLAIKRTKTQHPANDTSWESDALAELSVELDKMKELAELGWTGGARKSAQSKPQIDQ